MPGIIRSMRRKGSTNWARKNTTPRIPTVMVNLFLALSER